MTLTTLPFARRRERRITRPSLFEKNRIKVKYVNILGCSQFHYAQNYINS
jgi:hypothetical protein